MDRAANRGVTLIWMMTLLLGSAGVFTGCDSGASARTPATQGVSWTAHFDPEGNFRSIDDVRASVDVAWVNTFLATPQNGDDRDPIELSSCDDFLAVRHRRVWVGSPDHGVFQSQAAHCVALDLLLDAKPFSVDHLGTLVFDAALPERLPVGVASMTSASEYEAALADPRKPTWAEHAGPLAFTPRDGESGTYSDGAQTMTLALLARGDFSGDGIADALLISHERAEGGSGQASRVLLVTQRTSDGAVELLKTFNADGSSR